MEVNIKKSWLWYSGFLMLFLFAALLTEINVYATPAEPSPQKLCQADGTVITGYVRGDEFFSWIEDEHPHF